tara:strand:- start:2570 stop:3127 length:558 start_codon:yes stop_codon:yes gene_type:complete
MKQSLVGTRYAKALLQLAIDQKVLDRVYEDMTVISKLFLTNKDFLILIKSPIVKTDKKIQIIKKIFGNNFSDLTNMFVNIITKKKRENKLKNITESFIRLYKKHNNIETVTLTTAVPVDEFLKTEIKQVIHSFTKNKVELEEVVEKDILGGAIIRIGDKQLDASVARLVKELKQKFNKNLYIEDY